MGPILSRWRRDAEILLRVSAPFALVTAALLMIGRAGGNGWDALDFLVYAIGVGALWAVVVVGCLIWTLIRDGWLLSSLPAALILATLMSFAADWAYRDHAAEADCRAASAFYQALPTMPAARRAEAIAGAAALLQMPSDCAIDGFQLAFSRPLLMPEDRPALTDAERAAVLAQLLDAGLPPSHRLLYGLAVDDADADGSRLVLQRRKRLNAERATEWELFPDDILRTLIARARTDPGSDPTPFETRYREVLAAFIDEGSPDPAALPLWLREQVEGLDRR